MTIGSYVPYTDGLFLLADKHLKKAKEVLDLLFFLMSRLPCSNLFW